MQQEVRVAAVWGGGGWWVAGFKQGKSSSWTFQEESPESESLFGEKARDQLPCLSVCLPVSPQGEVSSGPPTCTPIDSPIYGGKKSRSQIKLEAHSASDQRSSMTCSKSHSKLRTEPGWNSGPGIPVPSVF